MVFLADSFGDNQDLCAIRHQGVAANNTPAPSIIFMSNLNKKNNSVPRAYSSNWHLGCMGGFMVHETCRKKVMSCLVNFSCSNFVWD